MRTLLLLCLIAACAPKPSAEEPIRVIAPDDEGKPPPSPPKNRKVFEQKK